MIHRGKHESKIHYANRLIWHAKTAIKFLKANKRYVIITAGRSAYRKDLKGHKWLLKYGESLKPKSILSILPPHYSAWLCIHNGEGSWRDSGDPYWGGLQMDRGFMSTYSSKFRARFHISLHGFANSWTPIQQMWVAEMAYESGRGFYPWPVTARNCGLI
jgi:hypothetical protein